MCTVTVVPHARGFRVVCNRDEKRTRPAALPPDRHRVARSTAVWPVDPSSGGTWIGANDAGLAMVVLNRTPRARTELRSSLRSRGTIIPVLLRRRRIESVLDDTGDLPARDFEPFTLLVLQGADIAVLVNTGRRTSLRTDVLLRPLLFTSSSLGDHLVAAARRALFARMVARHPAPLHLDRQAAFHCHRWRSRPAISVLMTRPDAATVSRTVLDIDSSGVRMRYVPLM